jgi:hypothetical protein
VCYTWIYNPDHKNWKYMCRPCHRKHDRHRYEIDMSNRRCSFCNGNKTSIIKRTGRPFWSYYDGCLICDKCRARRRRNSKLWEPRATRF